MWLAKALQEWRDFYLLVGTAGATLLALLFVALSVGAGYLRPQQAANTRTFMSPVVIHFTTVFFVSAIALVPAHGATFFAVLIGATAVIGTAISAVITVRVVKTSLHGVDVADRFAYGVLPALGYAALLVAAALMFANNESSLDVLPGALLLLLVVNIRNAWDLTLAMVLRHSNDHSARS